MCTKFKLENLKGRANLIHIGIKGWILLRLILKEQRTRMLTGFISLGIWSSETGF